MKTTRSINLGGYAFTIDEDAYLALNSYLERLRAHFRNDDGREEILLDIESRIAENFIRIRENGREVIEQHHIEDIISKMGDVKDFSDESSQHENNIPPPQNERLQKKLYKDPENAMIGGVAAGIASYFNIDPAIVRLAFVLLVFAGGSGFIIYLVLLFILPDADTPLKQSELKGESPTIKDIEKKVKDMLEKSKKKISEEIDNGETKEAIQKAFEKASVTVSAATKRMTQTTRVGAHTASRGIVRMISIMIGTVLTLVGMAGIVGVSIVCYTAMLGGLDAFSFIPHIQLYTNTFYTPLLIGALWLTVVLPLASLLALGISFLARKTLRFGATFILMLLVWMASLSVLGGLLLHIVLPTIQ